MHAWYSRSLHFSKSLPVFLYPSAGAPIKDYGYVWIVRIDNKTVVATSFSENRDFQYNGHNAVYLGKFDHKIEDPIRADRVPLQDMESIND